MIASILYLDVFSFGFFIYFLLGFDGSFFFDYCYVGLAPVEFFCPERLVLRPPVFIYIVFIIEKKLVLIIIELNYENVKNNVTSLMKFMNLI